MEGLWRENEDLNDKKETSASLEFSPCEKKRVPTVKEGTFHENEFLLSFKFKFNFFKKFQTSVFWRESKFNNLKGHFCEVL